MSRLLYRLSYPAIDPLPGATSRSDGAFALVVPPVRGGTGTFDRAPMRNRTADLLLTMETLCLLSYRGAACTAPVPRQEAGHRRTKIHGSGGPRRTETNRDEPGRTATARGTSPRRALPRARER